MKKTCTSILSIAAAGLMSACGATIPECTADELTNCDHGHAYAEERTILPVASAPDVEAPAPAPAPEPVVPPNPAPAPVVTPEPTPEPVQQQADPIFDDRLRK